MDRVLNVLALASLVVSGIYGTVFWATRDKGPPLTSFSPAANAIRSEYVNTDLIFLVPHYATRAKEQLGDLRPLTVVEPLREDFDVHPRAWVFGLFGEAEKLRPRMIAAGMKLTKSDSSQMGITVDLYETGAKKKVAYAFLEHLKSARVSHERNGVLTPCSSWSDLNGQSGPMGGRWSCPKDSEWFYVSPEYHRMDDVVRFCFWAHPPNDGRLLISFPDVPMTGQLFGYAGHTWNGSVHAKAPIQFDVSIENLAHQRYVLELEERWRPFALETPTTGTATVTFGVSATDAGSNHFCFLAESRADITE